MRQRSLNSLKRELSRYPHLNELEDFLERVAGESPALVILYGSLARGDYTPRSDIDVLCVYDREFRDPKERFHTSYQHSDGLVQPKTLTLEEFRRGLLEGNSFLHHLVQEGVLLVSKYPVEEIEAWITEGRERLDVTYYAPHAR